MRSQHGSAENLSSTPVLGGGGLRATRVLDKNPTLLLLVKEFAKLEGERPTTSMAPTLGPTTRRRRPRAAF